MLNMKTITLILILTMFANFVHSQNIEEFVKRGEAKFKLGDYQGGISDYNKAIKINPNDALAIRTQISLSSLLYYKKLAENKPYDASAIKSFASCKSSFGDYRGAIFDFSKAIEINPHDEDAYLSRAKSKVDLGDYRGALADYDKAIEINPLNRWNFRNRADLKSTMGNYKEAIVDYDKAIDLNLNKKNESSYLDRGHAKCKLKDYKGAISDYNKQIELIPSFRLAYYHRGLAKILGGDKDSGCLDLSKAGELGLVDAYEEIKMYCHNYIYVNILSGVAG